MSISPSNEYSGLISFRMDWLDLLAVQRTLKRVLQHHSSKASILQYSAFFVVQLSHLYQRSLWKLGPPKTLIWRRQWHPTPVLLPGLSHGRRSLVGCSPWGLEESDTTENFTFTFHFHALEKEMANHSSVLAWRIPGMGEPGELPSMGSHRVGHD